MTSCFGRWEASYVSCRRDGGGSRREPKSRNTASSIWCANSNRQNTYTNIALLLLCSDETDSSDVETGDSSLILINQRSGFTEGGLPVFTCCWALKLSLIQSLERSLLFILTIFKLVFYVANHYNANYPRNDCFKLWSLCIKIIPGQENAGNIFYNLKKYE